MENNVNIQSSFQFIDYLIEKSNIEISDPNIGRDMKFGIEPYGKFDRDKHVFTLSLEVAVKDEEDKFIMSFLIKGLFEYKCSNFNELLNFIGINAPAILFPYIRAYVSNITSLSGMQPVIMPTLNMQPIGKQLVEKLKINSED